MEAEAGRLRVLVVEDEAILAIEIEDLVEREGHDVIGVAADAAQTLALARAREPDLALVDSYLRDGLTGPEIGRALLREHNVPVLFVTATPETVPEDLNDALGILCKPFTALIFSDVMKFVVDRLCGEQTIRQMPHGLRPVRRRS